jgi:hypothetical protein
MNKGVLVGGGLGLMVLILLGGFWFSARAPDPLPSAEQTTAPVAANNPGTPELPAAGTPATTTSSNSEPNAPASPLEQSRSAPWSATPIEPKSTPDKKSLTLGERRAIRAEIQAKMTALLAKGQGVTSKDTQAFIDDVEKLGQGLFDPRSIASMREIVRYSARAQELSNELAQVAKSKTPKDAARQREILAELRDMSERMSKSVAALQSIRRDTTANKQP